MDQDFFFNFDGAKAYNGWGALTVRRAVLQPLFGKARGRDQIIKQTKACLMAWRQRASELAAARAQCAANINWEQRARNCTPAFVMLPGRLWACKSLTICPFCYARNVVKIWQAAERSFRPYFDLPEGTSPFWLLERRLRTPSPITNADTVRLMFMRSVAKRRELMRRFRAVGGYGCLRVEPMRRPLMWSFHNRQLYKVPAGGVYTAQFSNEQLVVHQNPTRSLLCSALARTCRYPKTWLRAPVADIALLLTSQAVFRVRTAALLGDFRNSAEMDADDAD